MTGLGTIFEDINERFTFKPIPTKEELIQENKLLKAQLEELKHLCSKEILAELGFVLRRQAEDENG